jgi:hypothetical protein
MPDTGLTDAVVLPPSSDAASGTLATSPQQQIARGTAHHSQASPRQGSHQSFNYPAANASNGMPPRDAPDNLLQTSHGSMRTEFSRSQQPATRYTSSSVAAMVPTGSASPTFGGTRGFGTTSLTGSNTIADLSRRDETFAFVLVTFTTVHLRFRSAHRLSPTRTRLFSA